MTDSGIFITRETLGKFPHKLKADLLEALFNSAPHLAAAANDGPGADQSALDGESAVSRDNAEEDDDVADLTPALARRFIRGCSSKTIKAITAMVSGSSPEFQVAAIAKAVSVPANSLTGVWAGITRRTRTVTGDDDVYLIRWISEGKLNSKGEYIDQTATLSEMTYNALRKALNV